MRAIRRKAVRAVRADARAGAAADAQRLLETVLALRMLCLRIVAPLAFQWAALEKDGRADA